mmetsp:Transcript_106538/g.297289  ORF Transcript_106538/g.297289 Transcript_106538/m.297289 type:complete len:266 (-) Transcript_106538:260-1057(-)
MWRLLQRWPSCRPLLRRSGSCSSCSGRRLRCPDSHHCRTRWWKSSPPQRRQQKVLPTGQGRPRRQPCPGRHFRNWSTRKPPLLGRSRRLRTLAQSGRSRPRLQLCLLGRPRRLRRLVQSGESRPRWQLYGPGCPRQARGACAQPCRGSWRRARRSGTCRPDVSRRRFRRPKPSSHRATAPSRPGSHPRQPPLSRPLLEGRGLRGARARVLRLRLTRLAGRSVRVPEAPAGPPRRSATLRQRRTAPCPARRGCRGCSPRPPCSRMV